MGMSSLMLAQHKQRYQRVTFSMGMSSLMLAQHKQRYQRVTFSTGMSSPMLALPNWDMAKGDLLYSSIVLGKSRT